MTTPFPIPPRPTPKPQPLFRIQLDYQLLLRRDWNIRARGALEHAAAECLAIHGEPGERGAPRRLVHGDLHGHDLARFLAHLHFLARRDRIARNVDFLAVDLDVAVANELTLRFTARGETHAVHHVIEA